MAPQDLDKHSRLAIQEIYALFRERGEWPTFGVVDRRLYRRHNVDAQRVLRHLPRRYYRSSRQNSPLGREDEVGLTLTAVATLPEAADDLERLVRLLRWLAEAERGHDPDETGRALVVTGGDVAHALSLEIDEPGAAAAMRLWELLELLPAFWSARSWGHDPFAAQMTITRDIRRYRDLEGPEALVAEVDEFWARADASFGSFAGGLSAATAPVNPIPQVGRRPGMVRPEAIDEFREITRFEGPGQGIIEGLRRADEKAELEPALMRIIGEVDETPHGPTEIADLTTAHLRILGEPAFAGVVIKGRGSKKVRATEVADQLQRAVSLPSVGLVVLAAVGDIQDDAKQRLAWLAEKAGVAWLVLDRGDLARLFVAYGQLCPTDGRWLSGEPCPECGWTRNAREAKRGRDFTVLTLQDTSHPSAKRFTIHLLVPPNLERSQVVALIRRAVPTLRSVDYSRDEGTAPIHRPADVLFLFVYQDVTDRPYANWICRAMWVSPELSTTAHPAPWGAIDSADRALRFDWNSSYDAIASLLTDPLDKGMYLRAADRYIAAADALVDDVREIIESDARDATHQDVLSALNARVEALEGPDGSRAAPHECADLDNMVEAIVGDLINLALPFTDRGREVWPDEAARLRISRSAIRRFDEDRSRLAYERAKVRS